MDGKNQVPVQVTRRLPANEDLHRLGLKLLACCDKGVSVVLEAGECLARAHAAYCKLGRNSEYGKWLKRYGPSIERKTADRWRRVYECFSGKLNADSLSKFRLTALYALSEESVPERVREEAIARAEAGETISVLVAEELRTRYVAPALPNPKAKKRKAVSETISVAGGKVTVHVAGSNVLDALKSAIETVEQSKTKEQTLLPKVS